MSFIRAIVRRSATTASIRPSRLITTPAIRAMSSGTDKLNSLQTMTRDWCTARLICARLETKTKFETIAKAVGRSEVWTTSAMLGQQAMNHEEANKLVTALKIEDTAERSRLIALLQQEPSKGCIGSALVPTDPLIYRFYELIQVYGTTWKALIHEKFGDGIMSAVDFDMAVNKVKGSHGEDRVQISMTGKFLPYKKW